MATMEVEFRGYPTGIWRDPSNPDRLVIGRWVNGRVLLQPYPITLTEAVITWNRRYIEEYIEDRYQLRLTQARRDECWDYLSKNLSVPFRTVFGDDPWHEDMWTSVLKTCLINGGFIPGPGFNYGTPEVEDERLPLFPHLGKANSRIFRTVHYLIGIDVVARRVGGYDPHR